MKETFRMWRMLRLLYDNQYDLAVSDSIEKTQNETPDQQTARIVSEIMEVAKRDHEPNVLIVQLALKYVTKYNKKATQKESIKEWDNPRLILDYAKSIILNCKQKEFVYFVVNADGSSSHLLRITLAGKKFATYEGLLKEWISDDVGVLWSTIIPPLVVLVGAVKWDLIKTLIATISPWW